MEPIKRLNQTKLEMLDRYRKDLGLASEDEAKLEEEGFVPVWKKEKRNPRDYDEIVAESARLSAINEEKKAQEKARIEEQKKQTTTQQTKELNDRWDSQLEDLRSQGKLPKLAAPIKDKLTKGLPLTEDDKNDPGYKAQNELFQTMYAISTKNLGENKPVVNNLKEVFYEHYQPSQSRQPAGASAPISGGSKQVSGDGDDFSYGDLKKSSFYDIVNES